MERKRNNAAVKYLFIKNVEWLGIASLKTNKNLKRLQEKETFLISRELLQAQVRAPEPRQDDAAGFGAREYRQTLRARAILFQRKPLHRRVSEPSRAQNDWPLFQTSFRHPFLSMMHSSRYNGSVRHHRFVWRRR